MRLNVTPIGSARMSAGQVARAVVEYLAGSPAREQPAGGLTGPGDAAARDSQEGVVGYYADSVEGPGQWLGMGARALGLDGAVDRVAFEWVLEGRDPATGERLLRAQGSADRAHLAVGTATRRSEDGAWLYGLADAAVALGLPRAELEALVAEADGRDPGEDGPAVPWLRARPGPDGQRWVTESELERFAARAAGVDAPTVLAAGDPAEMLTVAQAARLLGVSRQYVRSCCRYGERHRQEISALDDAGLRPPRAWLAATRAGDGPAATWLVTRTELAAFVERRQRPVVRVGYDLTLSTEKSVAVLALLADTDRANRVLGIIDDANRVALGFMDARASFGRRHGRAVGSEGLVVASFLHATSRALDPFPHRHNVVANAVIDEHGERRALDGRLLYRHAPAAAALATAELRWRLSSDLGVRWRRSPRGVWEVDGIPDATIREFSTRRDEVDAALAELSETLGRPLGPADTDKAVLATRAAKVRTPVDGLRAGWWARARHSGLDHRHLAGCFERGGARAHRRLPGQLVPTLEGWLDGALTAEAATFSRGEVIEAICGWVDDGELVVLPPAEVVRLADRYLSSDRVIELDGGSWRARDSIIRRDRTRIDATGGETTFATVAHLRLEQAVVDAFDQGTTAAMALVPAETLPATAGWEGLVAEQQAFVEALCASGMAVQCAVGRPGSGKTHSLAVVARAWQSSGYRVLGAAVKGEAARLLGEVTGVRTETVAWWLTALGAGKEVLDARTVVIVDEASTLGTGDLAALADHASRAGAALRLVGDPAQHGPVSAGGMFRFLCRRCPQAVPVLAGNNRQTADTDRFVVDAVRAGHIAEAMAALRQAGQLTELPRSQDLYAAMVTRWLAARHAGDLHPMVDRRNHTRRVLNALAHRALQSEGDVSPTALLTVDGIEFCAGDEVIARRPARTLHPAGQPERFIRNGSRGRVTGPICNTAGGTVGLTVHFDTLGTIDVPVSYIQAHRDHRDRAVPGLDYGYALTSYAVQGATLPVSSSAITPGARRRELYVNLTRGQRDNHLFVTGPSDPLAGEGHLPSPPCTDVIAEVVASLARPDDDRCALAVDPTALQVAETKAGRTAHQLRALRQQDHSADRHQTEILDRAIRVAADAAGRAGVAEPPAWTTTLLPARPDVPWLAHRWDAATAAVATYLAQLEPMFAPFAGSTTLLHPGHLADDDLRVERDHAAGLVGDLWASVAAYQLATHARRSSATPSTVRRLTAAPPVWMHEHLAELGLAGVLRGGIPAGLIDLYADIDAFRQAGGIGTEPPTGSGPLPLLGERPDEASEQTQWDQLTARLAGLTQDRPLVQSRHR